MSFAVSRTAELASPKSLPPFATSFPSLTHDESSKERGKFEWAGGSATGLFCQWSNLFNASHWRMVWDIIRFNYQSLDTLRSYESKSGASEKEESIGQWLQERGYGDGFKRNYLIVSLSSAFVEMLYGLRKDTTPQPMASSIWSTPPSKAFSDFPARTLLQFMHNHHLLQILDRPQWLTLHGGSKSYVERVVSQLKEEQIHKGPQKGKVVDAIRNDAEKWLLRTEDGEVHEFDRVVFATHADTTVKILKDEFDDEESKQMQECLESFRFSQNTATLHSDTSLMPIRRSAWSAWNFLTESLDDEQDKDGVTLTYWMNLLQSLSEEKYGPILVTLNAPKDAASKDKIVAEYDYDHPIYTAKSVAAQKTLSTLQGWKGCRFAGAWSNYGFHEDGFTSGLKAAHDLGAVLPFEVKSAERKLPKSSRISSWTLVAIEAVRFYIAPYLAFVFAPIYIAFFLLLETLINGVGFLASGGRTGRSVFRNELRSVRASWERQFPIQWQSKLEETYSKKVQ
jgi:predicted NAD/FAD-binding protein